MGPVFPGRRPTDHTLDLWYSFKSPPATKSWEKKVPKGRTDSDKAAFSPALFTRTPSR